MEFLFIYILIFALAEKNNWFRQNNWSQQNSWSYQNNLSQQNDWSQQNNWSRRYYVVHPWIWFIIYFVIITLIIVLPTCTVLLIKYLT